MPAVVITTLAPEMRASFASINSDAIADGMCLARKRPLLRSAFSQTRASVVSENGFIQASTLADAKHTELSMQRKKVWGVVDNFANRVGDRSGEVRARFGLIGVFQESNPCP